uniref:Putative secreted protein n=1 Tax=Ixodes scapularis TaxID=6945 RepID=A0A4D5RCV4_IXOSC
MCCPWRWAAPATWPLGVGASPPRTRPTRSTSGAFPTRARPGRSRARTSLWAACATCRSTPSCRTWPTAASTGTSTSTPAPPSKGACVGFHGAGTLLNFAFPKTARFGLQPDSCDPTQLFF